MAADGFAPLKSEWIGPLRIDLPFQEIERGIACKPRRGLVGQVPCKFKFINSNLLIYK